MKHAAIVFDLDGALVDTAPDLIAATNHALRRRGLPEADAGAIRPEVGRGARWMIEAALASLGRRADAAETASCLEEFFPYYAAHIADESRPFPGAMEVLAWLTAQDARLAVCTNKPAGLARRLLEALDMARFFHAVLGGDSLPVRKPDPRHLLGAIAAAGGDPRRAVMVGDTSVDIETARAAKAPVIAVSFGYSATPVEQFAPDWVIGHFRELRPALERLLPPLAASA